MKPSWLTALAQTLPQSLALAVVDSFSGETRHLVDRGLDGEVDLDAVLSTATDFSLGDELLELQDLIRDNLSLVAGRRETLLLAGDVVLLFVIDPVLDGSTLVVICRATTNIGLVLVQVRQGLPRSLEMTA